MKILEKLEEGVSNTDVGPCTPLCKTRRPSGQHGEFFARLLLGAVHSQGCKRRENGNFS